MGQLVSFPYPSHNDEHLNLEGSTSVTASWTPPALVSSPKYNIYLGTSQDKLESVSLNQEDASVSFEGMIFHYH